MKKSVIAIVALMSLSACGTSAADLPLPGSKLSGPSYEITAAIDDALNLAVGAPVKLNGVTVGRVNSVTAHDFVARIAMDVRKSTPLHAGADIRLRSTTPLGELFVDVSDEPAGALLADGDSIGADSASAAPTIEDGLAAASMLINGGGLGQIQTIVREVNEALGGREDTARDLLGTLDRTMNNFNGSSKEIDQTLDALADLSEELNRRNDTIDQALVDVAPAARVLSDNTDDLAKLLQSVDRLSTTTTRVVRVTRDDFLTTLRELGPVLDQFVSLKGEFGPGLDALVAFAKAIDKAVPGNYLNVNLQYQSEIEVGVPNLPAAGDLGVEPLVLPDDVIKLLPIPPALRDLIQPGSSQSGSGSIGLLNFFGGER